MVRFKYEKYHLYKSLKLLDSLKVNPHFKYSAIYVIDHYVPLPFEITKNLAH